MGSLKKAELEARFMQFCRNLSTEDRVAIIHHSDADGLCSALITAKAIERITKRRPVAVMPYEYGNVKQGRMARDTVKKKKANIVIVVDLGIDSAPHGFESACTFQKCLVIDHHKMYKDLNDEKTVFLKAQFFTEKEPSSYVTSKLAFDLFGKAVDISDLDWLACIGILGDMSLAAWKDFVAATVKKRNVSMTWLYRFLDLIAAVEVVANKRIPELFWEFYDAKNPADILENRFHKYLKEFKKEKDLLVEGFAEKAENFPEIELFFYSIKARHESIKSYVINEISEMHPHETIILIQFLPKGRTRFSARRQDFRVRVNDLLTEAVKGIPNSSAGGHAPAAAGSIPRQYLGIFKKNVVEMLEKQYAKK
jgi:single-stranded DNA-specific DHH superfamily exonuclease